MSTLTLIAGLPGSGKTTLLEAGKYEAIYDDFYATQPISDEKGVSANKNPLQNTRFSQLIGDLLANRHTAVSDIAFCAARYRNDFLAAVFTAVPDVEVRFIFFDNDPERARRNVTHRNRQDRLEKELQLIDELSKQYSIVQSETRSVYET